MKKANLHNIPATGSSTQPASMIKTDSEKASNTYQILDERTLAIRRYVLDALCGKPTVFPFHKTPAGVGSTERAKLNFNPPTIMSKNSEKASKSYYPSANPVAHARWAMLQTILTAWKSTPHLTLQDLLR